MTDVRDRHRRLARSLAPLLEESLPGFLLRLSHRLGCSPTRVAELGGLSSHRRHVPARHLLGLPEDLALQFARVARLSTYEIKSLTLQHFAAAVPILRSHPHSATRTNTLISVDWGMNAASRYCPACLRGDGSPIQQEFGGAWKLRWHLPLSFACIRHDRLLADVCPGCHQPLNGLADRRLSLLQRPRVPGAHPAACRNAAVTRDNSYRGRFPALCGTRLDASAEPAPPSLPSTERALLIDLQQRLDADVDSDGGSAIPDLLLVTHLIKLSWPLGTSLLPTAPLTELLDRHLSPITQLLQEQRGPAPVGSKKLTGVRTPPTDAGECAALLLAADTALGERDLSSLRERLRPLAQEAYQRAPSYIGNIVRASEHVAPDLLRAIAWRAHGYQRHSRLRQQKARHRYTIEEIPSFLPKEWFDTNFAELMHRMNGPDTRLAYSLRRASSLQLTQFITGETWPSCAPQIGIPPGYATKLLASIGKRLNRAGLWLEFENRVRAVACQLDSSGTRINYARRRQRMADWHLPEQHWDAICRDIPRFRSAHYGHNPHIGEILVWCNVTQGERALCPLVRVLREDDKSMAEYVVGRAGIFHGQLHTPRRLLRLRLDRYASLLSQACDLQRPLDIDIDEIAATPATSLSQVSQGPTPLH